MFCIYEGTSNNEQLMYVYANLVIENTMYDTRVNNLVGKIYIPQYLVGLTKNNHPIKSRHTYKKQSTVYKFTYRTS
jgi:hypothetical protein